MREVKNWETANKTIQNANKTKVIVIRDLLVKGYTFGEIAKLLGKNSRQTIYQFYNYNCKNKETKLCHTKHKQQKKK